MELCTSGENNTKEWLKELLEWMWATSRYSDPAASRTRENKAPDQKKKKKILSKCYQIKEYSPNWHRDVR